MIDPIVNLRSDLNHPLSSKKEYFYLSSIGENLQRTKSYIYSDISNQSALDQITLAETAYNNGSYSAAANFTNNAIQMATPLAAYEFRVNSSGMPAFTEELKRYFFKYSRHDIFLYGRSPVYSHEKVNIYA